MTSIGFDWSISFFIDCNRPGWTITDRVNKQKHWSLYSLHLTGRDSIVACFIALTAPSLQDSRLGLRGVRIIYFSIVFQKNPVKVTWCKPEYKRRAEKGLITTRHHMTHWRFRSSLLFWRQYWRFHLEFFQTLGIQCGTYIQLSVAVRWLADRRQCRMEPRCWSLLLFDLPANNRCFLGTLVRQTCLFFTHLHHREMLDT